MRRYILYVITVFTLPLIFFNFIATLCAPFLGYFSTSMIHYILIVEVCIWYLVFLSSFFLYRAHCSHSCAITGVFEVISHIKKNKDIMNMKYPKALKKIVTSIWFLGSGYVLVNALGNQLKWFDAPTIFNDPMVVLYYSLFFISGVLGMSIGKSNVEHYICPLSPWIMTGIKLGKKMKLPSLAIVTDPSKCVKCKQCSHACIINQDICQKVISSNFDSNECMNCFECVNVCKTGALKHKWNLK